MPLLFDSHCHLGDDAFVNDLEDVYQRALDHGVNRILVLGWDLKSSKQAIEIASRFDGVYAAVGFHPENLEEVSDAALKEIEMLSKHEKVIAIGEIGLDYHWYKDPSIRDNQKGWFIKQIEIANRCKLPVSIHAREAYGDMLEILKVHKPLYGSVLHCYSGSVESLKIFAKLGCYFGFDGPITYKNAIEPKECVKACPIDRLLVETDSPYLSPVPLRGTRNEPKNIVHIASMMADLKGIDVETLSEQLNRNFEELFHVKTL